MNTASSAHFNRHYQSHLKHLKLKGLQPKTVEAYSRAIHRIGDYFDHQIDRLTVQQLTDYFSDLVTSHSWSTVMACSQWLRDLLRWSALNSYGWPSSRWIPGVLLHATVWDCVWARA